MRDDAFKTLLEERWRAAAARYGLRPFEQPEDGIALSNRAVALYEAERWAEAAQAFEEVLRREGPASEMAPPALFSLGYCRLQLDDARGALEASTLFLELSNEEHPFYRDGVQNVACAASRLGELALAVQLHRVALGAGPDQPIALAAGRSEVTSLHSPRWSRERILRAALRVLGWRREPLPPSMLTWRSDG
jgi:tetratricopeptide (TPR) repeat protein